MMMSVKTFTMYSKSFFAFLQVFKLLSMCVKFQVKSSLYQEKSMVGLIPPPPSPASQQSQGQNMFVRIGLIELNKPSDTFNYKPFFKHFILQTYFSHIFTIYICMEQFTFC